MIAWSEEDGDRAQFFWSECFRLLRSENATERLAGECLLLGQPVSYRDRAEIQQRIDHCLEFAASKTTR